MLLNPSPLRVALGCVRTRPAARLNTISTTSLSFHTLRVQSLQQRPLAPIVQRPLAASLFNTTTRYASTDASLHPTSDAAASQGPSLTWNEFLRLRKVRRRFNLVGSVVTALGSFSVGMSALTQQRVDYMAQQLFGLDPFFVMGLWTAAFIALGWLLGPLLGSAAFRFTNRSVQAQMAEKERVFFERIKKFRVDPSSSSVQNPVPDYYGEKITSVAGYRQWLKDQRAFNKKRQANFV